MPLEKMHSLVTLSALPFGGMEFIFVGFVVLIILLGILGARAARQRREALQQLAGQIGFAYAADDQRGPPPGGDAFGVFNRGDTRRAYNTLTGHRDCANGRSVGVVMGDYRYTTESGSGKDRKRTTHHVSYALVQIPFVVVEQLGVRREGFFDRIAGAIGFEDIDFESAEFSRKYHVASSDRKVAYDLFDPRMIEWCMSGDDIPPLEIRGSMLLSQDGRTWQPEQFKERLDWLVEFIGRWPEHLVQRLEKR